MHIRISADKRDISGGQAEEKETQMEMLKVMPATGLLMEIDNKEDSKVEAQTLNDVCYYYLIIALTLITCNMLYMAGHLSLAIARISCRL